VEHLKEAPLLGKLLTIPTNVRLVWKGLTETYALAFYEHWYVMFVKSFMTLVVGLKKLVQKRFYNIGRSSEQRPQDVQLQHRLHHQRARPDVVIVAVVVDDVTRLVAEADQARRRDAATQPRDVASKHASHLDHAVSVTRH
jgi:hypothetical protein